MKFALWLVVLFFLALIAGAGLLRYKTTIPDIQPLNYQIQTHLSKLSELDSTINELLLRTRVNIEDGSDVITQSMTQLKDAVVALSSSDFNFEAVKGSALEVHYSALRKEVEAKSEFVENFKTQFAVLRNSQLYAPVVGARLVQAAQISGANDEATLYRDTIIALFSYSNQSNSVNENQLLDLIAQLQTTEETIPEEASIDLMEFIRHADTVLNDKVYVDTYLTNALQTNTQKLIIDLGQAWAQREQELAQSKQTINYVILAYVIYILLILAVALYLLCFLHKNLEKRAADKADELQLKFDQLKHSEMQLIQAEKISSLSQLVTGVVNEVNTPLGYVSNNVLDVKRILDAMGGLWVGLKSLDTEVLAGSVDRDTLRFILRKILLSYRKLNVDETMSVANDLLEDSTQGLEEVSQLVASLNDFIVADQTDSSLVYVNEALESTLKMCSNVIGERNVIKSYSDLQPQVHFTPEQLNQVFLNILTNAVHATSTESGEIHIKTDINDQLVVVEFADNGCGMDETTQTKILTPFFTTKSVNKGAGLGMSIVEKLVKSHGGDIIIGSFLGKGTTVTVILPIA